MIRIIVIWSTDTIHSNIEQGSLLYRALGKEKYLGIEDLPNTVESCGQTMQTEFRFNTHGILNRDENGKTYFERPYLVKCKRRKQWIFF